MRFALAVHQEAGKYGVTVLDLPGCFAAGDSMDEAIEDARSAIDAHVELLIEGGEGLPEVKSIERYVNGPEFKDAVLAVIDVPVERYFGPAEKINITVPALTLKRIDEFAAQNGESRSGFLVQAAEQAMRKVG
jgi:predicted RNase H-like HicB family nuclease